MSVRLDHVNITVRNLEESIEWYGQIFGFKKVEGGINQFGRKWAVVALEDSMVAMSEHKDREDGDKIDEKRHAIYHFGLRVPNAPEWRAKVKDKKLKLYYGGEVEYPYSRSWYVHDPSGHEIEVSCTDGLAMRFPG